jgi:hypothetical protein
MKRYLKDSRDEFLFEIDRVHRINSIDGFLSECQKARSLRKPYAVNEEDEVFGAGNCDPETEYLFCHNEG